MTTQLSSLSSLFMALVIGAGCSSSSNEPSEGEGEPSEGEGDVGEGEGDLGEGDLGEGEGEGEVERTYATDVRTINVQGTERTFTIAIPSGSTTDLPVVISLHGDGGTGAGLRSVLNLEPDLLAVHVYPNAVGGTFEYYTDAGRTNEVNFVTALVAELNDRLSIDVSRVFLTGFSGGATMANALGCRMGDGIRGMGIHSGTLYAVDNDFAYTGNGGVDCLLPATLFVWGVADMTGGVSYADGQNVRGNYLATQSCAATTTPTANAPCEAYDGCERDVVWCGIDGLGHSVWPEAHGAMAAFFATLL